MKIAQIQMKVTPDKETNLRHAGDLIRQAAAEGIDMAVLPELFVCTFDQDVHGSAEEEGGHVWQVLSTLARELGIWIIGGTIPERAGEKYYNTCYVFDAQGRQAARCRKTHLCDTRVPGSAGFGESELFSPGRDVTVFDTPWGKMGLCICYDFRFEEQSRLMALQGAQVIFVPAAFNMTTGPAHWEILFRQRAVDNQLFTVGVAPARNPESSYVSWAHSMVCDPWGTVIRDCGEAECASVTEMDLEQVASVRWQLPLLEQRREDLYEIRKK